MTIYRRMNADGTSQSADAEVRTYRAQMAFAFADHMILANAQGSAMGDALGRMDAQPHDKPAPDAHLMPINAIVRRACDLAEALYVEMCRREFVLDIAPEDPAWRPVP